MKRINYFNQYWKKLNSLSPEIRKQIIDLGMGMPDPTYFQVPQILFKKLHEAIDEHDFIRYCHPEGNQELLQEIADYENSQLTGSPNYSTTNIVMTPGAIAAFTIVVDTLLDNENEILVFNPSYFSLTALSELKAKTKVVASRSLNFDAQLFKKSVTKKTKLVFFCNPNSPTGLFIPQAEIEEIISLAQASGILVVIDESCRNYIFEENAQLLPKNITQDNVIRIKSFSKEQNLAGYRLGYILASDKITNNLRRIIPVFYGNPTVMTDRALLTELQIKNGKLDDKNYNKTIASNFNKMSKNRDLAFALLDESKQIERVVMPEACYYIFAKCKFYGNSLDLFEQLVDEYHVDVCPGVLFGMPIQEAWIRICFARKPEVLQGGINRLLKFLKSN